MDRAITHTITFPIPECEPELQDAIDGWRYRVVLQELDEEFRSALKHETVEQHLFAGIEWARSKLHECAENENIDIW
jgi:hypothetical protein